MKHALSLTLAIGLSLAMMAVLATPTLAQSRSQPGVRLTAFATEPAAPAFGEPFDLHLTLQVSRDSVTFLPDTLPSADALAPLGPGRWAEIGEADGMVEVRAVYPLIAYQAGLRTLPELELWVGPMLESASGQAPAAESSADADSQPSRHVRSAALATALTSSTRRLIPVGGTTISPYAPLQDETVLRVPRPRADVIGRDWSLWLVLAIGVVSVAGVGGARSLLPRWWAAGGRALVARLRGRSPRQEALRELDRIRGLGWHLNGRLDDFYLSTTDTLRRFTAQSAPGLAPGLTSSEMLAALDRARSPSNREALEAAIERAERVKFGPFRPDAETAETDWTSIRDWIRRSPES